MTQDEARFGGMGEVSKCWAPYPVSPDVRKQMVREYLGSGTFNNCSFMLKYF